MSALADQIDSCPMILPALKMSDLKFCGFPATKTTAQQNAEKGSVSFALERSGIGDSPERPSLINGEPIAEADGVAFRPLHPADSSCEVWAQQAAISGLVCKAPYGCQSSVNRVGCELARLQVNSIASHDSLVEGQPWFRAIPLDEFVNGMAITLLRLLRWQAVENC
jgi:hypothetical protein